MAKAAPTAEQWAEAVKHLAFVQWRLNPWLTAYPRLEEELRTAAMLGLADAAATWNGSTKFTTYLRTCLRNRLTAAHKRSQACGRSAAVGSLEYDPAAPEPQPAPDLPDLERLLLTVPPRARRMLRARAVDGETLKAIGEREGITHQRVRQIVCVALQKLRDDPRVAALVR